MLREFSDIGIAGIIADFVAYTPTATIEPGASHSTPPAS